MQPRLALLVSSDECGWPTVRDALRAIPDVQVAGETTSPREACRLATKLCPHLVVAAAKVDGHSTTPLLTRLRREVCPESKIVVMASRLDPDEIAALAPATVDGYLLWADLSPEVLRLNLAAITRANVVVASREVVDVAVVPRPFAPLPPNHRIQDHVTEREVVVLRWLAQGLTKAEISDAAGWSERTTARLIKSVEAKLDAPNRFVLAHKATLLGLLP